MVQAKERDMVEFVSNADGTNNKHWRTKFKNERRIEYIGSSCVGKVLQHPLYFCDLKEATYFYKCKFPST